MDESAAQYEARLAAFLATRPGGKCSFAELGERCSWTSATGRPGAYARFVRDRPHLFTRSGETVKLRHSGAAPPGGPTEGMSQALLAACVAHLQSLRGKRSCASMLRRGVGHVTGSQSQFLKLLVTRPDLFEVDRNAWVRLRAGVTSDGPPPPPPPPQQPQQPQPQATSGQSLDGCALCGVAVFTSAQHRVDHLCGRPHLTRTMRFLAHPKYGVAFVGPAEVTAPPAARYELRVKLVNNGSCPIRLVAPLRLLNASRSVALTTTHAANTVLGVLQELDVCLVYPPEQAGVRIDMVVATFAVVGGAAAAAAAPVSVGYSVKLRRVDQAAAEDLDMLAPKSRYTRPRRPPHMSAPESTCAAATCVFTCATQQAATALVAVLPNRCATQLATLLQQQQQPSGLLAGVGAAWMQGIKATAAAAVEAVVMLDGAPAASLFDAAHLRALEHALARVADMQGVTVRVVKVTDQPTTTIPGVPLPISSPNVVLPNVPIPAALRAALGKPDSDARAELEARLARPLSAGNYEARFKELLLLEEIQQQQDIRLYDMPEAVLEGSGGAASLRLRVPGLAEARPSVMRGDKVLVRGSSNSRQYEGVVHGVELETLVLRFAPMFHGDHVANQKYHTRFTLRRSPMLLAHAALGAPPPAEVLFPTSLPASASAAALAALEQAPLPDLWRCRRATALNERQKLAVKGALYASESPAARIQAPYIIFGPPGTGKTSTVVEYVLQVVDATSSSGGASLSSLFAGLNVAGAQPLVLVAAPSNTAVDELAKRLFKAGLGKGQLLRVNAYQRDKATLPPDLLAVSLWDEQERGFTLPTESQVRTVRVIAATCAMAQKLAFACGGSLRDAFTHVAVDEAGQATEPEALEAISRLLKPGDKGGHRVVLAGDPKQLGPVLRCALASSAALGVSLLERLIVHHDGPHRQRTGDSPPSPETEVLLQRFDGFHPAYITMLTDNYRSHPSLLAVPNELFYTSDAHPSGALHARADLQAVSTFCTWEGLTEGARTARVPLLFHGVAGEDTREGNSPSWFNPVEAAAVLEHVKSVLDHPGSGCSQRDVGVVTPYHKQAQKIRQLLAKHGLSDVTVGSVEVFQGGERSVIVLSCVRSRLEHVPFDVRHGLGFVSNPKRFNVAVTRAKALLIVVGNPHVLCADQHWATLLQYAIQRGAYRGVPLPPGFDGDDSSSDDGGQDLLHLLAEQASQQVAGEADAEAPEFPAMPHDNE